MGESKYLPVSGSQELSAQHIYIQVKKVKRTSVSTWSSQIHRDQSIVATARGWAQGRTGSFVFNGYGVSVREDERGSGLGQW